MWTQILIAVAALVAVLIAVDGVRLARRRRRLAEGAIAAWRGAHPGRRLFAVQRLADESDHTHRNALAWYLVGCEHLAESRFKEAARAFGVAHHADFRLESAVLLTFTCLKVAGPAGGDWLVRLVETWREMGRPRLLVRPEDRAAMDCLGSTTRDPPALSPLGLLAWLAGGPPAQARLERLLSGVGTAADADLIADLRKA